MPRPSFYGRTGSFSSRMKKLALDSPAKINLYLRVLGKKADGYHYIYTLFQRLALRDRLTFQSSDRPGLRLTCDDPRLELGRGNLICKAYELMRKSSRGFKSGVRIHLQKRIPMQAGLGGGSSNAAVTLMGLNRLFGLGKSQGELSFLGAELGADVPFFLTGASQAIGQDRGDRLSVVSFKQKQPILLVFNPDGLSTAAVYQALGAQKLPQKEPKLTKVSCDVTMLSDFFSKGDRQASALLIRNDLQKPAFKIKPAIGRVLFFLKTYLPAAAMTGSGSAVFALAPSLREARSVAVQVAKRFQLKTWTGMTD